MGGIKLNKKHKIFKWGRVVSKKIENFEEGNLIEKRAVKHCHLRGTRIVSVFLMAVTLCLHLC